jgi:hypothetical protein
MNPNLCIISALEIYIKEWFWVVFVVTFPVS